ncbi:hypothetical protein H0H87_011566 [Tephrocybe sp. NHM501043]|nr:hypothetical protein H0H87_011566 [Tephrocybe sp. NHM501043]
MPVLDLKSSLESFSGVTDGGLTVTKEMRRILKQPGFISLSKGGQRLRNLSVDNSMAFEAMRLTPFGLSCYIGRLDVVQQQVCMGVSPKLNGTETPYEFGYATLIISGAQRVKSHARSSHLATLQYLVSLGLPVDIPDIAGLTALHHAVISQSLQVDLARELLKAGANVNHQNRYGEVALLGAFQKNHIAGIDLLLEHGADLDIEDADGIAPGPFCLKCGPQVTAIVQKWVRKRSGEEAPRAEKRCDCCSATDKPLKNCSKCHVVRYCSVECQRKAWSTHKKTCQPFTTGNTATVKPYYSHGGNIMPTQVLQNKFFGVDDHRPDTHYRSAHVPKNLEESKNIVIKVQLPYNLVKDKPEPGAGSLLVYTKKRDFVCTIRREDGPSAYDRIANAVVTKGVGGAKAYFAAELKSKDELVVKVSQILAEQPF